MPRGRSKAPDELFREALSYIDDDELFLSFSLSLIEDGGPASVVHFMRHTRDGREKTCPICLSYSHDEIMWPHSSLINKLRQICGQKHSNFDLAHARKLVHGQRTNAFRTKQEDKKTSGPDFHERSFSIVGNDRSLDLVAPSREAAQVWTRTIQLLLEKHQSDANTFEAFIELHWAKADTDRSGTLTFIEIQGVIQNMSIHCNKGWIEKKFSEFDKDGDRTMNKDEFAQFVRHLFSNRPEVEQLMASISSEDVADEQHMASNSSEDVADAKTTSDENKRLSGQNARISLQGFIRFWNTFNRSPLQREIGEDYAKGVFRRIVGSNTDFLDTMEFAMYLDGRDNDVFDPSRSLPGSGSDDLMTYMSQPLNHYWINSSHNTYLTGDQVKSESSAEQYGYVLQRGARCVEIDCWDGDDGKNPVVTHGMTLCTKVKFKDVIEEIKSHAFAPPADNHYPVIVSIEMHCTEKYQKKMAQIVTEVLGDQLYTCRDSIPFPSPEDLKFKVLLKGDRLGDQHAQGADSNLDDSAHGEEIPQSSSQKEIATKPKKAKIVQEWSDLIALPANKQKNVELKDINAGLQCPKFTMQSYAEAKALKMLEKKKEDFIDFNLNMLSRIFPSGTRVDSSNMNPVPYWSAGCHAVALNFQKGDLGMSLNHGKFRENARLGYVLKHPSQRRSGVVSASCRLNVWVLSCQRLPPKAILKGKKSTAGKDVLDVYVRLEMHGTGSDSKEARTKTVHDNGFNPTFGQGRGELFSFNVKDRESAMLRVVVVDDDIGKDFQVGQNSLPLTCVRPGYRHVPLFDSSENIIRQAGVLCRFEVLPLTGDGAGKIDRLPSKISGAAP